MIFKYFIPLLFISPCLLVSQEVQSINSGAFTNNSLAYGVGTIYVNTTDIDNNSSGIIGAISYYEFGTLSLETLLQDQHIQFYPNPVEDMIYLKCDMAFDEAQIYDLKGRLVFAVTNPQSQIDLSSLEIGVYIIKFNDAAGTSIKIIKK
ncbi:MAG: T9SS type A sorting domain-containing protein [Nonlabens sp.]